MLKLLTELFLCFARIGVMTFGGGYAMLPMLQREICENRGWATDDELMDYFAIGQCTPGVIAVNTATFIGQKLGGVAGGIAATLGVVTPSVIIISVIAGLISNFAHLPLVANIFAGVRVCVCVLVFNSVVKLFKSAAVDKLSLIIFVAVFLIAAFTDVSPVVLVLSAALAGILAKNLGGARS